jgi:tetratricopeptide (TPR) repeat protein
VPSPYRSGVGLSLALIVSSACTFAGEKPWTEVRSPNFRVLTDGSPADGRRVAREFEQMRAVFAIGFPKMRLETGAPLVIFAPRDENSMKAMAPARWETRGPKPGGMFQHGWERQYAVVRLDQDLPGRNNVVYHEYVHSLLHANFRWLPTWLDEGLAEFYGNTRFEQTKMYVGAPSTRVVRLQGATLIKLDELLGENPWSKYGKDELKIDLFYSESWALVHYLVFGQGMDQGKKLTKYYDALMERQDEKKAFEEVFGSFKDVEDGLANYTRKFTFGSYVLQNPPQIQERDFPARTTTLAETNAELGAYRLFSHDKEEAARSIEQALHEDANLALAHETLGFLDFSDGKDDDAKSEFAKAYAADPQRYLSLYYRTMLSAAAESGAEDALSTRTAMFDVLKANPRFAPAFVELAFLSVRAGDASYALNLARKAEGLEPSRAGYHLLVGRLQLAMGHHEEAAKEASFVVERWRGPDRDEAVELATRIPGAQPTADPEILVDALNGTKSAQGTLLSVACQEKNEGPTLVIQNAEGQLTFRASRGGRMVGYSDTLWFGSDHFTLCHHLEGLRAIVRYKPGRDPQGAGEWTSLELREDLPSGREKTSAPPVDAKK